MYPPIVMRYHLDEPATHSRQDSLHGAIDVAFDAGEVEPQSEQEEIALEALVRAGFASVVDADAKPNDEPADEPEPEDDEADADTDDEDNE